MKELERLFRKKSKLVIGLMSGTSADGIDAAVVKIVGSGVRTKIKLLAFETYPYPKGFQRFLLKNSQKETARLDEVTRLNFLIARLFADAAARVARKAKLGRSEIDLIGSHGQTVQHLPDGKRMFGKETRATLQIGAPSVIAKLTGIVTVGDFRSGDVAAGGSGAPLVPYFDYLTARSIEHSRALLNIGGIANITVLPGNCTVEEVVAFDTGPGNILIDALMRRLFRRPYDRFGSVAARGRLLPELLRSLISHPYMRKKPPKSTGREMFGESLIGKILRYRKKGREEDLIATISEFTALSIYDSYLRFIRPTTKLDELFVSGGGVHNHFLMNRLCRYFHPIAVSPIEHINRQKAGLSADAKEAVCFAVLANETIAGNPANVPGATGARKATVLGNICLP